MPAYKALTKDTVSFSGEPVKIPDAKITMFLPILANKSLKAIAEGAKELPGFLNKTAKRDNNTAKIADFMLEEAGIALKESSKMPDAKKLELLKNNLAKMKNQFLSIIRS